MPPPGLPTSLAQETRRDVRVLVADPSAYHRDLVRAVLARHGVRQVSEAADGAEAVGRLSLGAPDLLIVDWGIPIIAAAEVIQLARDASEVPEAVVRTLVLICDPTRPSVEAAIAGGADAILARPFSAGLFWSRFAALIPEPFDAGLRSEPPLRADAPAEH